MKAYSKKASIVILMLPAIVSIGCDGNGATESESTASLSGFVLETESEAPIPGAIVTVGGGSSTTEADGRFAVENVPIGPSVTVQAEATGFDAYSQNVAITEGLNTHDILLSQTTIFSSGDLVAFLSPDVSVFRGVLHILPGSGGDSRPLIRGQETIPEAIEFMRRSLEFAEIHSLAIMGSKSLPIVPGTYLEILSALERFAEQSGHPELAHAPLLLAGISMGGCLANSFNKQFHTRIIGFLSMKGGCHDTVVPASARAVPAYLFIGEHDLESRESNITTLFEQNRAEGALWAIAIEPDSEHEPVADNDLLFNWMDAVIRRRLPESVEPGSPVELRPVSEDSGWLGNRIDFSIGEYACYDEDRLSASWLPDERSARDWQAMVSREEVGTEIHCGMAGDPSPSVRTRN